MNKKRRRLGATLLVILLILLWLPSIEAKADIDALKNRIEEAERNHQQTKDNLKNTQDNIDALTFVKDGLQGKLNQLTSQLTEVSDNLAELEDKIDSKNAEIETTTEDLNEAIAEENAQYEAMKARIKFIYEKKDQTYLDILVSSTGFADAMNKAGYIEELAEYDRQKLDEFKATRQKVEELKAKLEDEKATLDEYHEETYAEQQKVAGYVSDTSSSITQYSGQIKQAEALADAIEEQAKQEAQDIAALKKQLAEEIAMSKLAAQSEWRDISEVQFAEGDRMLLANLIYCEAGNQPYAGQLAVGSVVINRVLSSVYPDTVVGVIYQNKQFSPVGDGHLALALAENKATAACYKAADEAMAGQTNVGNCVYFRTPVEGLSGIQIGDHIFY
ncbi:cell wall hydrolase [Lacrimispora saccharolytica]|uniref:cell wall hydrolase n=1 Tax=Lacrimispora saccharolytica TaxID=84030 RepID=UPI00265CF63A|nr:cell wall hydrolase [Lacrimispora saccharolytica]MBS7329385.1 cell wall hydrolase [Lachnospiraceae bacterium]MCF2656462.1 cell wall hydrolase [Lacrimispora saccharolytica]MCI7557422.1 cell wall hydrolase [Lachnospiraceae bacterium]